MLNNVSLAGRLTADCTLRYSGSGFAFGNLTLAVDRPKYKDRDKETDFLDCTLLGKQAEGLAQYLTKGKPVAITGKIQTRTYEAQDGSRRKAWEVVVDRLSFLPDSRRDDQQQALREPGDEFGIDEDKIPF